MEMNCTSEDGKNNLEYCIFLERMSGVHHSALLVFDLIFLTNDNNLALHNLRQKTYLLII